MQDLEFHFDGKGNLDWRRDGAQRESFEHDELDRLHVAHEPEGSPRPLIETSFDALGNITVKSDVGAYRYESRRADGSLRPHAVTSAGDASFDYDENGDQHVRRDAAGQLEITYTAFDKPLAYTRAGVQVASFQYDADGDRRVRETAEARTVYVAGLYEQTTTHSQPTTTEHRYYLQVGGRAIAQVTRTTRRPADRVSYLHGDHLGSVDAITEEETAPVIERPSPGSGPEPTKRSFDAWGKERRPDWRDGSAPPQSTLVHRGFTGHEDDVEGLVNMGGRIYDPRLARFLQADPLVQAPFEPQNLNRYSYVMNRPLGYIDPSGYAAMEYDKLPLQQGQYGGPPVTTSEGGDFVHTGQFGPADAAGRTAIDVAGVDLSRDSAAAEVVAMADSGGAVIVGVDGGRVAVNAANFMLAANLTRLEHKGFSADLDAALGLSGGSLLDRHPEALAAAGQGVFANPFIFLQQNGPAALEFLKNNGARALALAQRGAGHVQRGAAWLGSQGSRMVSAVRNWVRPASTAAHNAADAVRLKKDLAFQDGVSQLLSGQGRAIAGSGHSKSIGDVARLVSSYGGSAGDWSKISSSAFEFSDGVSMEVHAYANQVLNLVVEYKAKLDFVRF